MTDIKDYSLKEILKKHQIKAKKRKTREPGYRRGPYKKRGVK